MDKLDGMASLVATRIIAKHSLGAACPSPSFGELMGVVRGLGLDARMVLDDLNAVLYDQLGFRPCSDEEYSDHNNSYIDKVCPPGGISTLTRYAPGGISTLTRYAPRGY